MNKSRNFGWFGFADSHEVMRLVMDGFAEFNMIPKLPEVM
jgi:hypothetical protein